MQDIKEFERQSIKIRRMLSVCKGLEKRKILNTEFKDAESIEEANDWALKNLGIEAVDYSRFDLRVANRINKQLKILQDLYPDVRTIKYIGATEDTVPEFIKYRIKTTDEKFKLNDREKIFAKNATIRANHFPRNVYASSTSEVYGKYQGIWFRGNWVRNLEKLSDGLEKDNRRPNHLKCSNTIEGLVTHEFSHQIHYFLSENDLEGFINEYWSVLNKRESKRTQYRISRAASNNGSSNVIEFFAELMTEYILLENPRPLALEMGKMVDRVLAEHRRKIRL